MTRRRARSTLLVAALSGAVMMTLAATPAEAQPITLLDRSAAGATADGVISPDEYSGGTSAGINSGFGGMLGAGTRLGFESDALGNLTLALGDTTGACAGNDHVVIYLDTTTGGVTSTQQLSDNSDLGRAAVSGLGLDGTRAVLEFAPGFEADYAIVFSGGVSSLFSLSPTTGLTFVKALTSTPAVPPTCDRELDGFGLADLGLVPGDAFDYVATVLNANDGFRSDEFHGVASTSVPAGNPGANTVSLQTGDFNTFESIRILVNEIDSDTPGGIETVEFVELVSNHTDTSLVGLVLVLYNGSNDLSYFSLNLTGSTGADNFYLIGGGSLVPAADQTMPNTTLQNGQDGLALYLDSAATFPNGTAPSDVNIVDAVVYGTNDPDATALLNVLTPGQLQLNEASGGQAELHSLQRCGGGARDTSSWVTRTSTPGAPNDCAVNCATEPDGTACDDGNACTQSDVCQAGVCTGSDPVVCTASSQCHEVGVCDPGTGVCSNPTSPDTKACDDGNACTTGDFCDGAGTCVGGTLNTCAANDTACADFQCNPVSGACDVIVPINEGGTCDDGNACTDGELCVAGTCTQGTSVCACQTDSDCVDDGDLCNGTLICVANNCVVDPATVPAPCDSSADTECSANTCIPATGLCVMRPRNENQSCDDGDLCTTNDVCIAGTCTGDTVDCSPFDDACNTVACDPSLGTCTLVTPVADDTPCDDLNACTEDTTCQAGTCAAGTLVCECATDLDCLPFEDGDLCNGTFVCDPDSNTCVIDPASVVTCDTSGDTACLINTCEPTTGQCVPQAVADDTPCDDQNLCTRDTVCISGVCAAGTATDCSNLDEACAIGVCNPLDGQCSLELLPDDTACDDGTTCTEGDLCQAGTCVGTPVADNTACDDDNVCTEGDVCLAGACVGAPVDFSMACGDDCNVGTCSPDGQCVTVPLPDNTTCDDDNPCTGNDVCTAGACGGTPVADDTTCDDGSLCTTDDVCTGGTCAGTPLDCSLLDGPCTVGVCGEDGACTTESVEDGTACDDGDACTGGDQCVAGTCEPGDVDLCVEMDDDIGSDMGSDIAEDVAPDATGAEITEYLEPNLRGGGCDCRVQAAPASGESRHGLGATAALALLGLGLTVARRRRRR